MTKVYNMMKAMHSGNKFTKLRCRKLNNITGEERGNKCENAVYVCLSVCVIEKGRHVSSRV